MLPAPVKPKSPGIGRGFLYNWGMKMLLVVFLALLGLTAQAQYTPGKSISEYTTKLGTVIHVGDTLVFARGLREDGTFRYATIPPAMLAPEGMGLPSSWNNKKAVVKDIREVSTKKSLNKRITVVFKAGVYNAQLDADSAEGAGEIVTAKNQKPVSPAASIADELLKLKSLLDSGAITREEFDTQKAKLFKTN
jgi:hypothetical protein